MRQLSCLVGFAIPEFQIPDLYLTELRGVDAGPSCPGLAARCPRAKVRQHPGQALFGDSKNGEQITHRNTRIAAHEMNNPMVCPTKSMFPEYFVWWSNKIPISIEEKFHTEPQVIVGISNLIIGL